LPARSVRTSHSRISSAARTASACHFSSPPCERASHQNTGPCQYNEVPRVRVPRAEAQNPQSLFDWAIGTGVS
jgi:hypothetical protein